MLNALIGIIPVLAFLMGLLFMDSFKLVRPWFVLLMILLGSAAALASFFLGSLILACTEMEQQLYARYVAPAFEELLKALIIFALIKRHRIGFPVDGAILGFAVGAGFATLENFYYFYVSVEQTPGLWIVRGFGTAVMHGGVTAIFAIISMTTVERSGSNKLQFFLPGLLVAVIIHSFYNHFFFSPLYSAVGIIVMLPLILAYVFEKSVASLQDWLELDFDADADVIRQINSAEFRDSNVGRYLSDLENRFPPMVIVDLLCYIRLYTELSMRAKGIILMRQFDIETPSDPSIEEKFNELRYLESSIGRTGMLVLEPFLQMDAKDLWHLNALESSHA